jgi:hypothetical protein
LFTLLSSQMYVRPTQCHRACYKAKVVREVIQPWTEEKHPKLVPQANIVMDPYDFGVAEDV